MNRVANDAFGSYQHFKTRPDPTFQYIWPVIDEILDAAYRPPTQLAVDVGCGTGATTDFIRRHGFETLGLENSVEGVGLARAAFPDVRYEVANAYDDLAGRFGRFGFVTSFEVIEHMYDPRALVRTLYLLTEPNGYCVISTPYHGYIKNLFLAIGGKWYTHLNPFRLGGHIKFFTVEQLNRLLSEEKFKVEKYWRVGRSLPQLAKSIVVLASRPA